MTSVTSLFAPVEADLEILTDNLKKLVGSRHPILYAAAEHLFEAGGKRIRPAIVLLVSRATMQGQNLTKLDEAPLSYGGVSLTPRHQRLAEITELIHTASLVHDDVVDESPVRRGAATIHSMFGNRVAILAGDFLFAQSSWHLAHLDSLEVVKLLSQVIMDMAQGEIQQGLYQFDPSLSLETYLQKSYYKTASLIANSAKAAAVLSDVTPVMADNLYEYGRNLGLAFQIVDDIFDFTGSTEALGKPAGSDLKSGNLTAPVLYALEEKPELEALIQGGFDREGEWEQAIALVNESQGIERSRQLAKHHAQLAAESLADLPPSPSLQALIEMTDYVLRRLY